MEGLGSYAGNNLLEGIAISTKIPLDHVNFVATQILALALAPLMRNVLHPSATKPACRQAFVLLIGLLFGYFAFGVQAIHLIVLPTICYITMNTLNPKIMPRWVLAVSIGYLSVIHIHRLVYDNGVYALDVTGPLMVMTQKITSLGFSLHDGLAVPVKELRSLQKCHAVKKVPNLLEYFSFLFHFQTLMAGPTVFYNDYVDFITGENITKQIAESINKSPQDLKSNNKVFLEPSPFYSASKKILASVICGIVYTFFVFPIERSKDEDFLSRSVVYQMFYLTLSTTLCRFKYYHAWLMADAINNISGLGFSGYDQDGNSKWDLISNVDIIGFELSTSLRDSIQNWNIGTNMWLRMVVYERVPKSMGVQLTFALSALWHGFYPGYYLTFATAALFTIAARSIRKYIRPHFLTSSSKKMFYDVTTGCFTRIIMTYATFSFVLLGFWDSMRIFWNMYFWLHLLSGGAIFLLPRLVRKSEVPLHNQLNKLVSNTNGVNSLVG